MRRLPLTLVLLGLLLWPASGRAAVDRFPAAGTVGAVIAGPAGDYWLTGGTSVRHFGADGAQVGAVAMQNGNGAFGIVRGDRLFVRAGTATGPAVVEYDTASGALLATYGSGDTGAFDVTASAVYTAGFDGVSTTVHILPRDGSMGTSFPVPGSGTQFLAVDPSTGNIALAQPNANVVRVYDPAGTLLATYPNRATYLVSYDEQGRLYTQTGLTFARIAPDGSPAGTFNLAGLTGPGFVSLNWFQVRAGQLFTNSQDAVFRTEIEAPIVTSLAPDKATPVTGQRVLFTAQAVVPFADVQRYEWDLDGDGSYEADTGTSPTAGTTFVTSGAHAVGVRVTGSTGKTTVRSVTVPVGRSAAVLSAPATALMGRAVTLDASGSELADSTIANVAWDLDGNGSYETSTGAATTLSHAFSSVGAAVVGVQVTRPGGVVDTASARIAVAPAPPARVTGVSIDDGAQFTNDPKVTLSLGWPAGSFTGVLSNDGGFAHAKTVALSQTAAWTLEASGPERLPKTVYVRYDDATQTFQDDIILDQTPPTVQTATIAAGARASAARIARRKVYRVAIKAKDRTSGIGAVQITARKAKPGKALRYKRTVTVRGARPRFVRARDRAGNYSRWRTLAVARKHHK